MAGHTRATLARLRRESGGQAMGEYAFLMALATGLRRVEAMLRPYAEDPRMLWVGAGAVTVLLVVLLRPKR